MKMITIAGRFLILLFLFSAHFPFAQGQAQNHLPYFELSALSDKVVLDWSGETDIQASYYRVERSIDGVVFNSLKIIPALAANETETYQYIDEQPLAGTNHYRIQQISSNQVRTLFQSLSLDMEKWDRLSIKTLTYEDQQLNLSIENPSLQGFDIRIFNPGGQMITEQSVGKSSSEVLVSLPLASVSRGLYVVQVRNSRGKVASRKFLY